MIPGEYFLKPGDITANEGRATVKLKVVNTGDRPVQIGSHFHFFEVNRMMDFDRAKAFGMRLNVPSGNAVRFEPGEAKEVELVALGGHRKAIGFNNLAGGDTSTEEARKAAMEKASANHFKNTPS